MPRALASFALVTALLTGATWAAAPPPAAPSEPTIASCPVPGQEGQTMRCGTLEVWENRAARSGRRIPLRFVILPTAAADPAPDPWVMVAGGPGQAATDLVPFIWNHPARERRDILLIDQRGTGGSHALQCDLPGSDDDLQGFLRGALPPIEAFVACRESLAEIADLAHYSSLDAAHDLDELRAALGYERLNLSGGSYGTRASLVYMRAYPERVRTAVLNGVAPLSFENPLYHARGAQRALERIAAECRADEACFAAFGDPMADFAAVRERLARGPVAVTIDHPTTGEPVTLQLAEETLYEGLRVFMYATPRTRRVPMVLDRAAAGSFEPLLMAALLSTRAIQEALNWGMLLSVTCSEDVDRISEEEIVRATAGTFLGDARVRGQKAACEGWPRSRLPEGWADDVRVDVPTLLLSGTVDPVTPPVFGERAAAHLPRSLHLVAPGAHGVGGPCIGAIQKAFLESGTVDGLDTSCVADLALPPFDLGDGDG